MEAGGPSTPTPGTPTPAPETPEQRLEGLRAWVAQLDRRLGVRSYAGAAAAILALAAAIVAVVLALGAREDSATKVDVEKLRDEVAAVERSTTDSAADSADELSQQIADLETQVRTLSGGRDSIDQEISVIQDDIDDLRTQISDLESSANSGGTSPNNQ